MSRKALDLDIARLEMAYLNHYTATQYYWIQFFSEHMADVSRTFRGDLQLALILAVVGQAALEQVRDRPVGSVVESDFGGINASRLADVTGIPRQTVRRKLALMAREGWIAQRADGSWAITVGEHGPKVRRDLAGLDRRGIARIARLTATLHQLASAGEG
jgi:hypothetical protein